MQFNVNSIDDGSLRVVCLMLCRKHMLALVYQALKVFKQLVPRTILLLRFNSCFLCSFFENDCLV